MIDFDEKHATGVLSSLFLSSSLFSLTRLVRFEEIGSREIIVRDSSKINFSIFFN